MAIVVQSNGTSAGASGTSCVITKPTGLSAGDLMVACLAVDASPAVTPPTSSWVKVMDNNYGGQFSNVFWKVADSGDAAASDFTFTWTGTQSNIGAMLRITGYSATQPVGRATASNATGLSATTIQTPFKTSNTLLVIAGFSNNNDSWSQSVSNANTTITERVDINTTAGNDASVCIATVTWNGTGSPYTTATATRLATTDDMSTVAFVVYEASDFSATEIICNDATAQNGTGTSVALAKPVMLAAGDLMVATLVYNSDGSVTTTPPASWTSIISDARDAGSGVVETTRTFWKVADSSDVAGSSFTFNLSSSVAWTAGITRFTRTATTSPIDQIVTDGQSNPGSTAIGTLTSITPTVANSMFVALTGMRAASSSGVSLTTDDAPQWQPCRSLATQFTADLFTSTRSQTSATGTITFSGNGTALTKSVFNIKPAGAATTGGFFLLFR